MRLSFALSILCALMAWPLALSLNARAADASAAAAPAAAQGHDASGIDWRRGDVDAAFAEARASGKPLFLYWGAVWCPPCNQVKATIFNRQDFIERSHFFVPVYIDGDSPGAQKLGARFKVSGYPTMILLDPNGNEILRLPGEVDATKYLDLLQTGMSGGRPVRTTLDEALSGKPGLTERDWRLLAYYSWETDEQQLVPQGKMTSTLAQLAAHCPRSDDADATRLSLTAVAVDAAEKKPELSPAQRADALARLNALLADTKRARDDFDLLTGDAGATTAELTAPGSAARAALVERWNRVLDQLVADATLSNTDRLSAMDAKISLARLASPKGPLPPALVAAVREQAQAMDRATTTPYERQSVISAAAGNLTDAGLLADSDTLLKAELTRSHSPYYFMLDLASNAKKRGDTADALHWYREAYRTAEGPATRVQWGVVYVRALVDLAPADDADIVATSDAVLKDVGAMQNAFYERNLRGLEKMRDSLHQWDATHQHDAALDQIQGTLKGVCAALPAADPQRVSCEALLRPKTTQSA